MEPLRGFEATAAVGTGARAAEGLAKPGNPQPVVAARRRMVIPTVITGDKTLRWLMQPTSR